MGEALQAQWNLESKSFFLRKTLLEVEVYSGEPVVSHKYVLSRQPSGLHLSQKDTQEAREEATPWLSLPATLNLTIYSALTMMICRLLNLEHLHGAISKHW